MYSRFLVCAHHVGHGLLCIMGRLCLLYGNFSRLTFFTHIQYIVRTFRMLVGVLFFRFRFVRWFVHGHRFRVCVDLLTLFLLGFGFFFFDFCSSIGCRRFFFFLFCCCFGIHQNSRLGGCVFLCILYRSICILLWGI